MRKALQKQYKTTFILCINQFLLLNTFSFLFLQTSLWGCLCDNWKPRFLIFLDLNGIRFRGELQHVGHVSEQKIKCWPIRTQEIGGVRLQDGLYVIYQLDFSVFLPVWVLNFLLLSISCLILFRSFCYAHLLPTLLFLLKHMTCHVFIHKISNPNKNFSRNVPSVCLNQRYSHTNWKSTD